MRAALLMLALVAGCGRPDVCAPFAGRGCLAIEIDVSSRGPREIDQIGIKSISGLTLPQNDARRPEQPGVAIKLPAIIALVPVEVLGANISFQVDGYRRGERVGTQLVAGSLNVASHGFVRAELQPADGPEPDMGRLDLSGVDLPPGSCDPLSQGDCASGQKCNAAKQCVTDGNIAIGSSCSTTNDQCRKGSFCSSDFGLALCRTFCASDTQCPATSPPVSQNISHCDIDAGSNKACTVPCNPVPLLGASGCQSGLLCYVYSVTGATNEYTNCIQGGSLAEGALCTRTSECMPGHTCVGAAGALHCRANCRKGNDADCTGVLVCHNITNRNLFGACCPTTGC